MMTKEHNNFGTLGLQYRKIRMIVNDVSFDIPTNECLQLNHPAEIGNTSFKSGERKG